MTMRPELEVYLTTYDGAQHLRLHGWLKRNSILIKSETIAKAKDHFGMFMIYVNDEMLDKLKQANIEQGMYCDMDVMGNESSRLDLSIISDLIKILLRLSQPCRRRCCAPSYVVKYTSNSGLMVINIVP